MSGEDARFLKHSPVEVDCKPSHAIKFPISIEGTLDNFLNRPRLYNIIDNENGLNI